MRSLVIFFFLAVVFNSLTWVLLVPMWHTPDEQAHFAQIAFLSEKNRNSWSNEYDVTKEIYLSELYLGTARDKNGNNKFTFHPEYRMEFTNSYLGKYEASISALSNKETKSTFVAQESTRYPLAYYAPAVWIYRFLQNQDLFIRVFIVRLWSLSLFVATIFVSFRLGKLLFGKDRMSVITFPILVSFQPMFIFSSIGVTSDALANLVFTLFLYFCTKLIIRGIKSADLVSLAMVSILALQTKIQFIIILPILFFIFVLLTIRKTKGTKYKTLIVLLPIICTLLILEYLYQTNFGPFIFTIESIGKINVQSFIKFTLEYSFPHTIKEVMPWYWGVYNWLGVTYPRIIYRIINRIVMVSFVGLMVWLIYIFRNKLWKDRKIQCVFFLTFVNVMYFLLIASYDWLSWYQSGFQLGVQGRYFFPLISVQMSLVLIGIRQILPVKWRIRKYGILAIGSSMILLNFFALYTVAKTYYDVSNLKHFLLQASQYKPFFAKSPFIIGIFFLYLISLMIFLYRYIKFAKNENC